METPTSETRSDTREVQDSAGAGPAFGPLFFGAVLADRVRAVCDGHPDPVPVVELHLADGYTVDLCHIVGLDTSWLAVQAYRDKEVCEEMDLLFVPYPMITRVTVSVQHRNQRPAGFLVGTAEE